MAEVFSLERSENSLSRLDGSILPSGVVVGDRVSLSRNLASFPCLEARSTLQRQEIQSTLVPTTIADRFQAVQLQRSLHAAIAKEDDFSATPLRDRIRILGETR